MLVKMSGEVHTPVNLTPYHRLTEEDDNDATVTDETFQQHSENPLAAAEATAEAATTVAAEASTTAEATTTHVDTAAQPQYFGIPISAMPHGDFFDYIRRDDFKKQIAKPDTPNTPLNTDFVKKIADVINAFNNTADLDKLKALAELYKSASQDSATELVQTGGGWFSRSEPPIRFKNNDQFLQKLTALIDATEADILKSMQGKLDPAVAKIKQLRDYYGQPLLDDNATKEQVETAMKNVLAGLEGVDQKKLDKLRAFVSKVDDESRMATFKQFMDMAVLADPKIIDARRNLATAEIQRIQATANAILKAHQDMLPYVLGKEAWSKAIASNSATINGLVSATKVALVTDFKLLVTQLQAFIDNYYDKDTKVINYPAPSEPMLAIYSTERLAFTESVLGQDKESIIADVKPRFIYYFTTMMSELVEAETIARQLYNKKQTDSLAPYIEFKKSMLYLYATEAQYYIDGANKHIEFIKDRTCSNLNDLQATEIANAAKEAQDLLNRAEYMYQASLAFKEYAAANSNSDNFLYYDDLIKSKVLDTHWKKRNNVVSENLQQAQKNLKAYLKACPKTIGLKDLFKSSQGLDENATDATVIRQWFNDLQKLLSTTKATVDKLYNDRKVNKLDDQSSKDVAQLFKTVLPALQKREADMRAMFLLNKDDSSVISTLSGFRENIGMIYPFVHALLGVNALCSMYKRRKDFMEFMEKNKKLIDKLQKDDFIELGPAQDKSGNMYTEEQRQSLGFMKGVLRLMESISELESKLAAKKIVTVEAKANSKDAAISDIINASYQNLIDHPRISERSAVIDTIIQALSPPFTLPANMFKVASEDDFASASDTAVNAAALDSTDSGFNAYVKLFGSYDAEPTANGDEYTQVADMYSDTTTRFVNEFNTQYERIFKKPYDTYTNMISTILEDTTSDMKSIEKEVLEYKQQIAKSKPVDNTRDMAVAEENPQQSGGRKMRVMRGGGDGEDDEKAKKELKRILDKWTYRKTLLSRIFDIKKSAEKPKQLDKIQLMDETKLKNMFYDRLLRNDLYKRLMDGNKLLEWPELSNKLSLELDALAKEQGVSVPEADAPDGFTSTGDADDAYKAVQESREIANRKIEAQKRTEKLSKMLTRALKIIIAVSAYVFAMVVFGSIIYKKWQDINYQSYIYESNSTTLPLQLEKISNVLQEIMILKGDTTTGISASDPQKDKKKATIDYRKESILAQYMKKNAATSKWDSLENAGISYDSNAAVVQALNFKKRELYDSYINAVQTYQKQHYFAMTEISVPFPWSEIFVNGIMLLVCVLAVVLVYAKFSPYILADEINDLNKCLGNLQDGEKASKAFGKCQQMDLTTDLNSEIVKICLLLAILSATIYMSSMIFNSTVKYGETMYARRMS